MMPKRSRVSAVAASALAVLLLLALLVCAPQAVLAVDHSVAVQVDNSELCFQENAAGAGVKMYFRYVVAAGGGLDIGVTIRSPDKKIVYEDIKSTQNRIIFKSRMAGVHSFCFSNAKCSSGVKTVAFSIIAGTPKEDVDSDTISRSVSRLYHGFKEIQELQTLLETRYRAHRNTVEVANTRVILWTVLEILAIVFSSVANVWFVRRMFSKRRMV